MLPTGWNLMRMGLLAGIVACAGGPQGPDRGGLGTSNGGTTDPSNPGTDPATNPNQDQDQDGFVAAVDCDDNNPDVNPGQPETPYNGLDDDCDAATPDDDLDGDGFGVIDGTDCDDANPNVNPEATEVAGNGLDDDCDPSSCLANGFASTPLDWSMPAYGDGTTQQTWIYFGDYFPSCSSDQPAFSAVDMTGDGLTDLVVTYRCSEEVVGRDHWLVYPGTGAGFDATPIEWEMPAYSDGKTQPWSYFGAAYASCGANQPAFTIADLNGDGLPDLVETFSCTDPDVGRDHWRVYAGTGSGFDASPIRWTMPAYTDGVKHPWSFFGDAFASCGFNQPAFVIVDLTGDGAVDLVETDSCTREDVGRDLWLVYEGVANGFATTPTEWAMPAYSDGQTRPWAFFKRLLPQLQRRPTGVHRGRRHGRRPRRSRGDHELHRRRGGSPPLVGLSRARARALTPPPIAWAMPDYSDGKTRPWAYFGDLYPSCGDDQPAFTIADLTNDGRPDLVETFNCDDPSVGRDQWRVYPGGAAGFEVTPMAWAMPPFSRDGKLQPWAYFGDYYPSCGSNQPAFAVRDMTGDGASDVVVTFDCADPVVGTAAWPVYPASCDLLSGA